MAKQGNIAAMLLMALAVTASACSDNDASRSAPAPAPNPPSTAAQPPECDMEGMDMSHMSAEEHRKMVEDCERARAARR